MFAIFTGNPLDPRDGRETITILGVEFPLGVPVALPESWSEEHRIKIARNNHFRVNGSSTLQSNVTDEAQARADADVVLSEQISTVAPTPRTKSRRARTEG